MMEQTEFQDLFGLRQHIYKLKSMNYLISTYEDSSIYLWHDQVGKSEIYCTFFCKGRCRILFVCLNYIYLHVDFRKC